MSDAKKQGNELSSNEIVQALPFANHRDLYVLIVGLVLGLLLSPASLGRFAPNVYNKMFIGNLNERKVLEEFNVGFKKFQGEQPINAEGQVLLQGDAQNKMIQMFREKELLEAALIGATSKHTLYMLGLMFSLIVALLVVFVIETQVSPVIARGRAEIPSTLAKLTRVRYVLMAGWLVLVIARPDMIMRVPIVFTIVLLVCVLVIGLVPFGKGERH